MTDRPLPDSPEANGLGCSCPVGPNNKGAGKLEDGVLSWSVNPKCPVHGDPRWWMPRRKGLVQ